MIAVEAWQQGQRTLQAEICCCPACGGVEIFRRGSCDGTAYWRCHDCGERWQETPTVGLGKRCNAKALRILGLHEAGEPRRPAELRCCEECGDTHVRRTSTVGRIGYWTCLGCGHGWTQVVEEVGAGLKVKLPQAERLIISRGADFMPAPAMVAAS